MFKPLVKGALVRLAAAQPDDAACFARWSDNDEYMRLLDDDPVRPQSPDSFASMGTNDYFFTLRTLENNKLIGFVVLFNIKWSSQSAEMAMGIGETDYWGKGYGSDGLRLLLNYAFNELNLHRVGLTVLDYNERAIKAYERAGFVREGVKRQAVQREGQRYDLVCYSLLRDEWLAHSSEILP
jgi:RimJ/RimL family protein N-acetyltransferase